MDSFASRVPALLEWFESFGRDLPWRRTRDPYAIWVSEVMLQQTQVNTALPYYERWMKRFPTVGKLAGASEDQVMSVWQGLGYYRRCRMLLQGASWVAEHGMPRSAADWRQVPGVGDYTAPAIASITMGEAVAAVDGNVRRVHARVCGEADRPSLERARQWSQAHLPEDNAAQWNQALMELGATICLPKNPRCHLCPLRGACEAERTGRTLIQSVRAESVSTCRWLLVPVKERRFGVLRMRGRWWQGLWGFPTYEAEPEQFATAECLGTIRHIVTRHKVEMRARLLWEPLSDEELVWLSPLELKKFGMPAPHRIVLHRALDRLKKTL